MTAGSIQIVDAFEKLGMSIPEIATEFTEGDESVVKAILLQFSTTFRKDVKKGREVGFSDDDHEEACRVITNLMRESDDDNVRSRMARYVRDDKKGRLDIGKGMGGIKIDVHVWNEQLRKMREAEARTLEIDTVKQIEEKISS